jgi:hypothetical protein
MSADKRYEITQTIDTSSVQCVRIMVGSSDWGQWLGCQLCHAFRASQQAR